MREIGELLRRTREEKGLSLKDVQVETKIRTRYLEALERGDDSVAPGEVYFRGFLRTYANFLGLDGQELAARYRALKEAERASQVVPPPSRRRTVRPPRTLSITALVLFLLAVLFSAWWAWQSGLLPIRAGSSRESPPGRPQPAPAAAQAPGPAPGAPEGAGTPQPGGPAVGPSPSVAVERSGGPAGVVTFRVQGATSLEVRASFRDRCWVRVTADGVVQEEATFAAGQERLWRARATLRLRLGNAGAVELSVNGVPTGVLGGPGQVIEVVVASAG
jgi:cytoskeletal protein RodZ